MSKRVTGRIERITVAGQEVAAFVPFPLPPADRTLLLSDALAERLAVAMRALSRLALAGELVPSLD